MWSQYNPASQGYHWDEIPGVLESQTEALSIGSCCPLIGTAACPFPWVLNSPVSFPDLLHLSTKAQGPSFPKLLSAFVHSALSMSEWDCTFLWAGPMLSLRWKSFRRSCCNRRQKQPNPSNPLQTSWNISVCSFVTWDRFLVLHLVWKVSFSRIRESQIWLTTSPKTWRRWIAVNSSCLVQGTKILGCRFDIKKVKWFFSSRRADLQDMDPVDAESLHGAKDCLNKSTETKSMKSH